MYTLQTNKLTPSLISMFNPLTLSKTNERKKFKRVRMLWKLDCLPQTHTDIQIDTRVTLFWRRRICLKLIPS